MNYTVKSNTIWEVEETTRLAELVIEQNAKLSAPEGCSVTLSVDGVATLPEPGVYTGDVVVSVTKNIPVSLEDHGNVTWFQIRTAAYVEDNVLVSGKSAGSALLSGEITGTEAKDIRILGQDDDFNGIYITGDSEYHISAPVIELNGNGGDDFVGFGAAITASGNSKVTIDKANIRCRGAMRPALVTNQHAETVVNDSRIQVWSGTKPNVGREQNRVPWMLGLHGNCRATNIVDFGTTTYNRCHVMAESWGVLSTDATTDVKLNVNDSLIEITGDSGYGAYSIGTCTVTFSGSTINVKDYGMVIANGPAGAVLKNDTKLNSGRFGVMWHGNQGGTFRLENSSMETDKTAFLIKGCGPVISCKNAAVASKNGVLLHLMDSDDPGSWDGCYQEPEGPDTRKEDYDVTAVKAGDDVSVTFEDMNLSGDLYNSTTFLSSKGGPGGPGGPDGPGGPGGPEGPGDMPMDLPPFMRGPSAHNLSVRLINATLSGVVSSAKAWHNVKEIREENNLELGEVNVAAAPTVNNGVILTLDSGSVWTVNGKSYLSKLVVSDDAELQPKAGCVLKLTVNGAEMTPASGTYVGDIVVESVPV